VNFTYLITMTVLKLLQKFVSSLDGHLLILSVKYQQLCCLIIWHSPLGQLISGLKSIAVGKELLVFSEDLSY